MRRLMAGLTLLALITVVLAACGSASTSASSPNTVHMSDINFTQSSITIKKGESITLVDDTSTVHIINNGMWLSNGTPRPEQNELGAPTVQLQFQGNDSHQVGPFNTPGTYHLYCTIHDSMNLTVTVQ